MTENSNRVLIIVALIGVFGTITGAVIANWDKIFSHSASPKVESSQSPAQTSVPSPTSLININGIWRDQRTGATSTINQNGDSFSFTATGPLCNDINNRSLGLIASRGIGKINGNQVKSHYQTNNAEGDCNAELLPGGNQMKGTCDAPACPDGVFHSLSVRQP